jgi:hypothetical protein
MNGVRSVSKRGRMEVCESPLVESSPLQAQP